MLLYALIPQDWLGGDASARGVLYGLRHDLTPVAAYFLGRGLTLREEHRRRIGLTILFAAAFVAAWGLFDIYAISLQTWRDSGVPGWFHEQLGLEYRGLSYLPENWVYNPGDEHPLRRLVSTFLSPLATAYMLVVAILLAATWRRTWWLPAVTALLGVGLLFTYSRTSIAALALGLCALAYALRSPWALAAAAVLLATGFFFVKAYPDIGPETRFTKTELQIQRAGGRGDPTSSDPFSTGESSVDSHLDSLRDGIDTVVHHPQGYGLGNAGVTAKRTGAEIKAGESTYTELGVELGLLGLLAFVAWSLALARVTLRREPWLGAASSRPRPRHPDRRDRRPLARLRRLGARRRARLIPARSPRSARSSPSRRGAPATSAARARCARSSTFAAPSARRLPSSSKRLAELADLRVALARA